MFYCGFQLFDKRFIETSMKRGRWLRHPIERGPGRINGAVESLKTLFNDDVEFNLEDF